MGLDELSYTTLLLIGMSMGCLIPFLVCLHTYIIFSFILGIPTFMRSWASWECERLSGLDRLHAWNSFLSTTGGVSVCVHVGGAVVVNTAVGRAHSVLTH